MKYSCGHCPITVDDTPLVAAGVQPSQNLDVTIALSVPVVLVRSFANLTETWEQNLS